MTGSLHIKNGVYYAVLNTYEDGKRKQKWINTGLPERGNKRKAESMLNQYLADYGNAEQEQSERASSEYIPYFHEYLERWLASKKDKIELSTWESYEAYTTGHLSPYFKKLNLKLNEVAPRHIKAYYEHKFRGGRKDRKKTGLSVASIKKHGSVMRMAFREALIEELVERNPVDAVPLPKQGDIETKAIFLTAEEANTLLEAFRDHELQSIVYVTLYYGLRRSESLGLRWSAVDFEKNTIQICHTVVKNRSIVAKDRTKSKTAKGTYQLLPEVKELLLKIKQEQAEYRKAFGRSYHKSDYIFTHLDGTLRRPDCVTRGFQRVLKNHGLKKMRFHDLRHSTASILHDKDWDIRDIQDWLRHADIETTGNIYIHISRQRKTKLAKDMENTFRL